MKKIILLSAIVITVIACSKKTTPTSGSKSNIQYVVMDDKAKQGMTLELKKCTSCHSFRVPYKFPKQKWDKMLPIMFVKSKMTDTTQQNLIKYFVYNNLQKPSAK